MRYAPRAREILDSGYDFCKWNGAHEAGAEQHVWRHMAMPPFQTAQVQLYTSVNTVPRTLTTLTIKHSSRRAVQKLGAQPVCIIGDFRQAFRVHSVIFFIVLR
jgi:hypothetical protein